MKLLPIHAGREAAFHRYGTLMNSETCSILYFITLLGSRVWAESKGSIVTAS